MNWNSERMTCDDARAAIADSIIGGRESVAQPGVEAHVATCAECRAYRAECRRIWAEIAEIPTPVPAPDARQRFERALLAERSSRLQARTWTRRGLVAAGFLAAVALGYSIAPRRAADVAPAVTAASQQYLLLLYETKATDSLNRSPGQIANTIAEYSAWARGLRANGKLLSAEKLAESPVEWFGGEVVATAGERVGGFFLIRAADAADARRIASDCPHVKHGGRVELRAIQKT